MDRRKFIAVGATALLAGCDGNGGNGNGNGNGGNGNGNGNGNGGNGNGNGNGGDSTPEDNGTVTPGGDFEATVTFESCTEFTVEAESFTYVGVDVANSSDTDTFEDDFGGSESFEASGPINSVTVFSDNGSYSAPNPDGAACREEAQE